MYCSNHWWARKHLTTLTVTGKKLEELLIFPQISPGNLSNGASAHICTGRKKKTKEKYWLTYQCAYKGSGGAEHTSSSFKVLLSLWVRQLRKQRSNSPNLKVHLTNFAFRTMLTKGGGTTALFCISSGTDDVTGEHGGSVVRNSKALVIYSFLLNYEQTQRSVSSGYTSFLKVCTVSLL